MQFFDREHDMGALRVLAGFVALLVVAMSHLTVPGDFRCFASGCTWYRCYRVRAELRHRVRPTPG